jgi:hypothetical protein
MALKKSAGTVRPPGLRARPSFAAKSPTGPWAPPWPRFPGTGPYPRLQKEAVKLELALDPDAACEALGVHKPVSTVLDNPLRSGR